MFNVEWFCVVVKPFFEVYFSGTYVKFLFIVELIRHNLCLFNDIWGWAFPIYREVVLVSATAAFLNLRSIVLAFHILLVYNWFYVLHGTVTYWFRFYWKCYSKFSSLGNVSLTDLKKDFPIFLKIFLLNGWLNHMIFLLCLQCFWWLVSVGLYVSILLYPDWPNYIIVSRSSTWVIYGAAVTTKSRVSVLKSFIILG